MSRKVICQLFLVCILIGLSSGCKVRNEPTKIDPAIQLLQNINWLRSTNPIGHTGLMIQTSSQVIYLDPVDLVNRDLPKADLILITHDHADHFSIDTIDELSGENTKIVSISSVTSLFDEAKAISIAPGEKIEINGIEIEGIPAYNSQHPNAMNYLGFVLTLDGARVYCSGDTAFNLEMETITNIDIAVMNVKPFLLSGAKVIAFSKMVKPRYLIPIHWMPSDHFDKAEIDYIQQNIPSTTIFKILELF